MNDDAEIGKSMWDAAVAALQAEKAALDFNFPDDDNEKAHRAGPDALQISVSIHAPV